MPADARVFGITGIGFELECADSCPGLGFVQPAIAVVIACEQGVKFARAHGFIAVGIRLALDQGKYGAVHEAAVRVKNIALQILARNGLKHIRVYIHGA